VVKCRPPGNRDPLPDELSACRGYLERQIEALNPTVIVTLGRYSMAHFLPNAKISSAHGKATWVNGRLVVAMYHPAAALHQPSLKETVLADFSHLPEFIQQAKKVHAGAHLRQTLRSRAGRRARARAGAAIADSICLAHLPPRPKRRPRRSRMTRRRFHAGAIIPLL